MSHVMERLAARELAKIRRTTVERDCSRRATAGGTGNIRIFESVREVDFKLVEATQTLSDTGLLLSAAREKIETFRSDRHSRVRGSQDGRWRTGGRAFRRESVDD